MRLRYVGMLIVAITAALWPAWAQEGAVTLYVAANGNDQWSGTLAVPNTGRYDGPFATITAARNAIRGMKKDGVLPGPVTVLVREGEYRITEPIVFTPEDSGTRATPIVYAAYPGEKPVLSGGSPIAGWKQDGNLWTVQLPEVAEGKWYFSALWADGDYRWRARTPNDGFLRTAGKATAPEGATEDEKKDLAKRAFVFNEGDIQHWENLDDVNLIAYLSWDVAQNRIASIDDANRVVTFKQAANWPYENWGAKQRYIVENIREGLDAPGEWYLDRKSGVLSYMPKEGESIEKTTLTAPRATNLVKFDGKAAEGKYVEFVTLSGIAFNHTEYTIPAEGLPDYQAAFPVSGAIDAFGARYCTIENCEVAHIANYAIWLHAGCQNNLVQRNHLHDLGAGGVRIGEGGSPASEAEAASHNVVDNNWIHDGGKIHPAAVGVWIGRSSYNRVSHNEISDLYYTGVSLGWSWGYDASSANHNIIEYNHIHNLGKYVLSDMGGIYSLGISPGSIERGNHIHHVYSYSYGGWGLYTDEGSSDMLLEGNLVHDTKSGGFHQHYGKENRVRNNIFAFATEEEIIRTREEEHLSFFFERNIVLIDNGRLLGSNWTNNNYRNDYNCYWDMSNPELKFKDKSLAEWQALGQDTHSVIADPLFENAWARDFRLRSDSPAIKQLGFVPIDATQAGLYGDPAWVDGPKQITRAPYGPPAE
ncbi:MAG: right-handed parallel beta-helix repeat-containing protein [Candidatus Hydrogenedentes bacterium]|nr:right-handed parallel beta-helix repeat-containing protein [Candidatus Hydrogenedentota bacterium]